MVCFYTVFLGLMVLLVVTFFFCEAVEGGLMRAACCYWYWSNVLVSLGVYCPSKSEFDLLLSRFYMVRLVSTLV